ncbi:HAD family hydrolase [Promicromonospora sp. NPDC050880]|uniref:HAD family hydrolase n=1 Tax=Promicromonospora sp. NPDC050880 TaxID=3364406 RepID=UPI00379445DF
MIDAAQLLDDSAAVLLDFDGPVTALLPRPVNLHVADDGRRALQACGIAVPAAVATTSDHLAVIRWTGKHAREALGAVDDACAAAETASARTCAPTSGANALLAALDGVGVPVVVVSNNAAAAIHAYLERHGLTSWVRDVVGRPAVRPDLMKPHPHTVERALTIAGAGARRAVLIGDSVSDIEVARATGVRSIGYATTRRRGIELRRAGADAVTDDIGALVPGGSAQQGRAVGDR